MCCKSYATMCPVWDAASRCWAIRVSARQFSYPSQISNQALIKMNLVSSAIHVILFLSLVAHSWASEAPHRLELWARLGDTVTIPCELPISEKPSPHGRSSLHTNLPPHALSPTSKFTIFRFTIWGGGVGGINSFFSKLFAFTWIITSKRKLECYK